MDSNKKTLFLWTIILLISSNVSSATFSCNSCIDCQAMIASASVGDFVLLTEDINSTNECIYVNHTAGITLDCQGHEIKGGAYAIAIDQGFDNHIRNCDISGVSKGIEVNYSNNISVTDSQLAGIRPVNVFHSNGSLINNNTLSYNQKGGMYIYYSNRNTISNNVLYGSDLTMSTGLILQDSNNNFIFGNDIETAMGIWITDSTDNTLSTNRACRCFEWNGDIRIESAGNTGSNNTCGLAIGYNDTGFTGCAHRCSATTSTTTTTTTTTSTTTTQRQCTLPGDYPPCGEITLQEVIDEINKWAAGTATLGEVIDLINSWTQG